MFVLNFLQASIASLLTGACAWALLAAASRLWPGLAARRAPWLLANAAVAASLALALLPGAARLSIVPALELPGIPAAAAASQPGAASHLSAPALAVDADASVLDDDAATTDDHSTSPVQPPAALVWLGNGWLAIYALGVAFAAARWLRARRSLAALLAAAHPLDRFELAAHPGFASLQRALPPVREVDAPISPMLTGLLRPVLLLPRHLRDFAPEQQRLVIEHELTHLARRDQLWLFAGQALQAALWFNPIVTILRRHLAWAQELGCDRAVLDGSPSAQRRNYAAALVNQLRMQTAPDQVAAMGFGGRVFDSVSARISMIRDGVPALPNAVNRALGLAALPLLLLASLALQPALAWRIDAAPAPSGAATQADTAVSATATSVDTLAATADARATAAVTAATPAHDATARNNGTATQPHGATWHTPLDKPRVSAFFGVKHVTGRQHAGMDFAARTGTPVMAADAGTVVAATNNYQGQAKYGEVIEIEHANGLRSMYAHLDQRHVKLGQRVAAGQQIGTAGATGKATGPHLHLEVTRNGAHIDPQEMLGKLEANATDAALRKLRATRS